MHDVPAWLTTLAIAAAAVAAIVFTILAIKNKNMKVGVGKEGPFVETKQDEPPEAAGSENISHVNVKARDVQGGIRIGHDQRRKE